MRTQTIDPIKRSTSAVEGGLPVRGTALLQKGRGCSLYLLGVKKSGLSTSRGGAPFQKVHGTAGTFVVRFRVLSRQKYDRR